MSTVFRVVKNENYTTLSNYHFKDKRLSWKAKGLLSTMLSLPDDWNYTIEGLAKLSDDGIKATNTGLNELEKYGYLIRRQQRNEAGHFGVTEYIIYEQPQPTVQDERKINELSHTDDPYSQPYIQNGQTDENRAFQPYVQNRQTEKRQTEKGMQLNTNISSTKELNTYNSSSSIGLSDQNETRRKLLLDEEEEKKIREHLEIDTLAARFSKNLAEAIFVELCKREYDFLCLMNARAMEQVCRAIWEKQQREPIRMLPNLINTYLDNIMVGIRAAGGGGNSPPAPGTQNNRFNQFQQNQYDFERLEKELLSN